MAKLKIYGNANPVVGKKEFYSVDEFFASSPSLQLPETDFKITPQEEVKWSIWVQYGNEWTKMTENNKTGTTVCYTFSQVSLTRKGIRMLVEKNGEKALFEIQTHKTTNPSIVKVDLLDANYNIPTKAFAYGETIIARVHCVDMEMLQAKVTLWEDSGDKANSISSNLIIESKQGNILNGICEVSFYLNPMNAWRVNANNANEGEMHEYYVTAEIFTKKYNTAITKNTNVANPQYIPSPAEQKGLSNKDQQQIAMSDRRVHDYNEQRVKISPTIAFPVREVTNSLMMVDMNPQTWWPFKEDNCGGKYCIKKGDKNELIREINIRLAGFGGNVPTDEFTDRTERMIKQFQRDYMQVPETGKICGNVLNAIDEFQRKYIIHFDDIKCKCEKCKGFGNELYKSVYKHNKPKKEAFHDYEYPGIHRSLVWLIRSIMFYTSVIEKDLGYELKCIFSGYRCWEDNKFNGRSSTNHMGKALDIHFSKNDKKVYKLNQIEEIRDKIILPYTNAQIRWEDNDLFSVEPSRKSYPKEFIATTWIHIDVREFDSKYLENTFFVKTIEEINGKNIVELAKQLGFNDTCKCDFNNSNPFNLFKIINRYKENHFTIEDAELSLKKINKKYGKEMARNIEMMYRWECEHFNSGQYKSCGSPGMEVSEGAKGPEYGWNGDLYEKYPEYTPIGLWSEFENKGKSGLGGNTQITDRKKKYIVFPSVDAGMHYVAEFILRHNGNIGRWHSLYDKDVQNNYIRDINSTIPRISNKF